MRVPPSNPGMPSFVPLRDVASVIPGVFSISRPVPGDSGEPMPMVTVRWLSSPAEPRSMLHIARVSDLRVDRYRIREGDVLVPSRSTSFRVAVAPRELNGEVFNSTLLAVRCSGRILPELLAAYLTHPTGSAHLVTASQSGTAQMNLTAAALGEIPVPIVSLDQQRQLAELLAAANLIHQSARDAADLRRKIALDMVISRMTGRTTAHA